MALHNVIGKIGEEEAINFLKTQGYKILDHNFRSKLGELDIVSKDGEQIVFVEVKTRSSKIYGTPSEAINYKKLLSLVKAAEFYLQIHRLGDNFRIDAVEVIMQNGQLKNITQIKNITL